MAIIRIWKINPDDGEAEWEDHEETPEEEEERLLREEEEWEKELERRK